MKEPKVVSFSGGQRDAKGKTMTAQRYHSQESECDDYGAYVTHDDYAALEQEHTSALLTINSIIEILGKSETQRVSEQVAELTMKFDALTAENSQMLRLLTDISNNHGEFVNEDDDYLYASVPMDYVSEINMYVSRDVNAENPFEDTDAAVAEMQAQGLDKLAEECESQASDNGCSCNHASSLRVTAERATSFACWLRKGAAV